MPSRARHFDATALCRGALRWLLQRRAILSIDATALCRGRLRWFAIASPPETSVKDHGTRPWHLWTKRLQGRNQSNRPRHKAVALRQQKKRNFEKSNKCHSWSSVVT